MGSLEKLQFSRLLLVAFLSLTGCEGLISDPGQAPGDWEQDPTHQLGDGSWVPHSDPGLRLLTRFEYDNTVRDLLGVDPRLASGRFPADSENGAGFDNGHSWSVSDLHGERHLDVAESVAAMAVAERWDALVPCGREGAEGCAEQFIDELLPRAFRRPITEEERAPFVALVESTLDLGFETAVELALTAILQSPQLLYQLETTTGEAGEVVVLDSYERATRLSYFLWASTPDDALLAAAESGELDTDEGIERHVRRLLDDERALPAAEMFHRRWLKLDLIDQMSKDDAIFPEIDETAAQNLRRGMLAFLDNAFDEGLASLTTNNSVWLTEELAPVYGVSDGVPVDGSELLRYELDSTHRAGFLTQPALLAMLSHPNQHSPILRGVFLREQVLCADLPDPPPGLSTVPPALDPEATTRERFTQLTADSACSSCHGLINPAGFLFENYDAIGRYDELENGQEIDASAELPGIGDPALAGSIEDAVDLGERLADSDSLRTCIARQWTRWALRGPEVAGDEVLTERVADSLRDSGGSFRELLVTLAMSDAMRLRRIPGRTR